MYLFLAESFKKILTQCTTFIVNKNTPEWTNIYPFKGILILLSGIFYILSIHLLPTEMPKSHKQSEEPASV